MNSLFLLFVAFFIFAEAVEVCACPNRAVSAPINVNYVGPYAALLSPHPPLPLPLCIREPLSRHR